MPSPAAPVWERHIDARPHDIRETSTRECILVQCRGLSRPESEPIRGGSWKADSACGRDPTLVGDRIQLFHPFALCRIGQMELDSVPRRRAPCGTGLARAVVPDTRAARPAHGSPSSSFPSTAQPNTMSADARRLPFPDASFDVIIACNVLEHIEEDVSAMRGLRRVVGPGRVLSRRPSHWRTRAPVHTFVPMRRPVGSSTTQCSRPSSFATERRPRRASVTPATFSFLRGASNTEIWLGRKCAVSAHSARLGPVMSQDIVPTTKSGGAVWAWSAMWLRQCCGRV
jgi:SAM-dependent methyltransferase